MPTISRNMGVTFTTGLIDRTESSQHKVKRMRVEAGNFRLHSRFLRSLQRGNGFFQPAQGVFVNDVGAAGAVGFAADEARFSQALQMLGDG